MGLRDGSFQDAGAGGFVPAALTVRASAGARGFGSTNLWVYAPLGQTDELEAIDTDSGKVAWVWHSTTEMDGYEGPVRKVRAGEEGVWLLRRPIANLPDDLERVSLQLIDWDGNFVRGQTITCAGVNGLIDTDMAIDGGSGYLFLNNGTQGFYRAVVNLTSWQQTAITTNPVSHTLRNGNQVEPGNRSVVSSPGQVVYTTNRQGYKPMVMLKNSMGLFTQHSPADNTANVIAAKVTAAERYVTQDIDGRIYYRPNGAQVAWSIRAVINPVVTAGPDYTIVYITRSGYVLTQRGLDYSVWRSVALSILFPDLSRPSALSRLADGDYVVGYENNTGGRRLARVAADFGSVKWDVALQPGGERNVFTTTGYCTNARGEGFSPGIGESW